MSKLAEAGASLQRLKGWIVPFAAGALTFALGLAAGVALVLMAQNSSLPFVRDNIVAGMAVMDAQESGGNRPGQPNDAPTQYPSTP